MEQCTLFWLAITLFAMSVTLIVMASIALHRLGENKELLERVKDKLWSNESHLNKIEAAVEWFLQKEGMKLECSQSLWSCYVRPSEDRHLRDWLMRTDERKRDALADALYKSTLQAMRDFASEQKKEAKKK